MTDAIDTARLRARLGGLEIKEMRGDNLAVVLCSVFDDGTVGDDDQGGWSDAAINGYNKTLDAIHAHYAPALDAQAARIAALEAALREADKHIWSDPGKADLIINRALEADNG